MNLSNRMRQIMFALVRPLWARIWQRVEGRVATVEGRLALIEGALNVMQRDPVAFFNAKSIAAISVSIPAVWQEYRTWMVRFDHLRVGEDETIRRYIGRLREQPKFSIFVHVHDMPFHTLEQTIASVRGQIYEKWELCIGHAVSGNDPPKLFKKLAAEDGRIINVMRAANGNESGTINWAFETLTGEYVALLDHRDVLAPHALAMMVDAINRHPDADVFYSDEDKLDEAGQRYDPWFKSDWNAELLKGLNYVSHLGALRTTLVRSLGSLRCDAGKEENALVMRLTEATKGPIVHIPHILCHRRPMLSARGSFSAQRQKASTPRRLSAQENCGFVVPMEENDSDFDFLGRNAPTRWPLVSAIVPTRDRADLLSTCVRGLLDLTAYRDLEVLIADNDSSSPETFAFFEAVKERGVRIVGCPGEFNYSMINNKVARHATGEILLFLNNDVEVIESSWLKAMVEHFSNPEVGAVGAKLLYADGTLQHGGVVLGMLGVAGHVHVRAMADSPGYFGRLRLVQDVSCVTGACMAVRRSVFEQLGGFEEQELKVDFNDVDLCIRIREAGHRIIWTPHAALIHHESKSRGSAKEKGNRRRLDRAAAYMRRRWGDVLDHDPFWNPNLSLRSTEPQIAFPPRTARPWL